MLNSPNFHFVQICLVSVISLLTGGHAALTLQSLCTCFGTTDRVKFGIFRFQNGLEACVATECETNVEAF